MTVYIPWTEKYKRTNKTIRDFDTNVIIFGPPGSGKTSYVNLLIEETYQQNDINKNVLYLNASDERGINTIRFKIKEFAKKTVRKRYNNKMIVLDESDNLTYDAQTALRRIMEQYSKTTIFIFICNYQSKIIDPICSRCIKLSFSKLEHGEMKDALTYILEKESVDNVYFDYINDIIDISNGDMRKAITTIETFTKMPKTFIENTRKLYETSKDMMLNILSIPTTECIKNILELGIPLEDKIEELSIYPLSQIIENIIEIMEDDEKYQTSELIFLLSEIDDIKNSNINNEIVLMKLLTSL